MFNYLFVTGVKLKTKDVIDTLKTEMYTPETPCMKRTSVHIKNTANKTVMCYNAPINVKLLCGGGGRPGIGRAFELS